MGSFERRHNASCQRNMIVLDQNSVGEIQTMVLPASATHRVFVQHAQAGHSLAGVQNSSLGSGDRVRKLASQRSNSAQSLQEIEDHSLTGKNHPGIVADHSDRLAVVQADAVKNFRMAGDFVV